MSQKDLATHVGDSYQQVQKYEKGLNRVSASVLYEFSSALGVPIAFFFEGLPTTPAHLSRLKESRAPTEFNSHPMRKPEIIKLVREFDRIVDPLARRRLLEVVRATADALTLKR